jgi:TonB family protein
MPVLRIAGFLLCIVYALGQESGTDALQMYRDELQQHPGNSLAHFRLGELFFQQHNLQLAANEFRAALNGDPHPHWIDAWAHIDLGELLDSTKQRDRAVQEYRAAVQTRDDTDGALAFAFKRLKDGGIDNPILHRVSRDVPDPLPTVEIPAQYSVEGKLAGLEGTVYLAGVVATDGSARNLQVIQPLGLGLDDAAVLAASRWKFEPTRINNLPAPKPTTIRVNFLLPSRQSRWHLLRVVFGTAEGASRTHFMSAPYPEGDGIGPAAIDAAKMLAVMGRQAVVTLTFNVDENGHPVGIRVQEATEPVWGDQAVSFVRRWQFSPAYRNGRPVRMPCTLDLVWGEKEFNSNSLRVAAATFRALQSQIAQR